MAAEFGHFAGAAASLRTPKAPLECGSLLSLLPPWFGEACFAVPGREGDYTAAV
jgi:hypothetical protein